MISVKDEQFLQYWEKHRDAESRFSRKLTAGLPVAMLFGLPIILSVIIVRLFFPEWYVKLTGITQGIFVTVIIAILILVFFYAYFRMQYKWEMNEQLFKELQIKKTRSSNQSIHSQQ
jgi:hypothetical protein